MPFRIDHVDSRVESLTVVEPFYTELMNALGATHKERVYVEPHGWTYPKDPDAPYNGVEFRQTRSHHEAFFGVIEESGASSCRSRIAFAADSHEDVDRIAALVARLGARVIERSDASEGPNYDAVFFEDPLGNRLEVVYRSAPG